tara:strand:- start:183 stop:2081 length:1899 start_codon:yes stop_codon:yes gene_type:complete
MSGIVNKVGSNSGKIWDGLSRADIPILPTPGADGTLLTSDGTNWAVEAPDPAFTAPAGSTWDAVAEGALSNGDRVLIRSDGKIEVANDAGTASDNVTPGNQNQTFGLRCGKEAEAQGTSSSANKPDPPSHKPWISWDPNDEDKFIVGYGSYNGTLHCKIGTMSGSTISFGSAVQIDGEGDHSPCCIHFHPSTPNLFAVAYGTYNKAYLRFGVVSGTSITMVSSMILAEWVNYGSHEGSFCFSWDYFSSTNHWALQYDNWSTAYGGPNTGKKARRMPAIICGVVADDATSPSKGSVAWPQGGYPLEMNDAHWWYGGGQVRSLRFDPNTANKFLVTGMMNNDSPPYNASGNQSCPSLYICTTNGSTSITLGSEINMSTQSCAITGRGEHWVEWNPSIANQIVFSGQQTLSGTSYDNDPVFVVGTVSGSSVSWGTVYRAYPSYPAVNTQPWQIVFGVGAAAGRFYAGTTKMPSGGMVGYLYVQAFDITGTTITTPGSFTQCHPHQWFDLFYNNDNMGVAFPWHMAVNSTGMKLMINGLRATGSGNHTKFSSIALGSPGVQNLTAHNYIGIVDAAYADGATATVQLASSSVDDSQSGLTTGSTYYVLPDGTLSTTAGSPSVIAGTALSATQLLIRA